MLVRQRVAAMTDSSVFDAPCGYYAVSSSGSMLQGGPTPVGAAFLGGQVEAMLQNSPGAHTADYSVCPVEHSLLGIF